MGCEKQDNTFSLLTIKKSERAVFLHENKPQNCLSLYFSAFRSHMIIHMISYSCKNILLHIVCYSAFFQEFKNLNFVAPSLGIVSWYGTM